MQLRISICAARNAALFMRESFLDAAPKRALSHTHALDERTAPSSQTESGTAFISNGTLQPRVEISTSGLLLTTNSIQFITNLNNFFR
jgi:hypothetical protein